MNSALLNIVETALHRVLEESSITPTLKQAVTYALFPGGKRIRPLLILALCEDLGANPDSAAPAAAAVELLHTSSLVHDDLPAMDDDDFRRGRETVHRKFGEATAILAGDLLVALALRCAAQSTTSAELNVELVKELAGTYAELCSGQQLDILPDGERGPVEAIHQLKTGALFRTCARFAALCALCSEQKIDLAGEFGLALGLAFQIRDDQIDGNEVEKGRPTSSDKRNARSTLGDIESNQSLLDKAKGEALSLLEELIGSAGGRTDQLLRELFAYE